MHQGLGFWINKHDIFDVSISSHIKFIINNPEKFCLTTKVINEVYTKYNERIGFEGKAREEIIKNVLKYGWIRVRHYFGDKDYWSIQFDEWELRKKYVKSFLEWAIYEKRILRINEEIALTGFKDGFSKVFMYLNGGIKSFLFNIRT